jgi:hypothetical protein
MKPAYLYPASWLCLVIAALLAVVFLLKHKRKIALPIFSVGVYLALVVLFVLKKQITDGAHDVYAYLAAAYDSFEVFKLGYDFDALREFTAPGADYRAYAAFLFVLAPVLTVSNVLSFFQTVIDKLRYLFLPGAKYILSEMNAQSIALAESIRKEHSYAQIIFLNLNGSTLK